MVPELLQGMVMVVVPVPPILRNAPSFASKGAPPFSRNAPPSPSRSKVALALLLNVPPRQETAEFVQVPAPLLTKVPPANVLVKLPFRVSPPLAETIKVAPALPKVPPLQEKGPGTVMAMLPWRVPAEIVKEDGVKVPLPLKKTLPPLMMSGALVMMQVPSNLAAPPLKVLVPVIFSVP